MTKILLIGPAPNNIGGISIHLRRLTELLSDVYVFSIIDEGRKRWSGVYNVRSLDVRKYFQIVKAADIVHIHSGVWILRLFHVLCCKTILHKRTLVTVHRDPSIESFSMITKFCLSLCDAVIAVNEKGYKFLLDNNKCKYYHLPAFIPPNIETEPQLPDTITTWIEKVRKNPKNVILCSNAWNLVFHNGVDLYGLDICIDAIAMLNKTSHNYFLIFVLASNTGHQELLIQYKSKIKELGLSDNIFIYESPTSFVRLLNECDIVLRCTNTDGDAISIREALHLGKCVVASDVVERPEGTIIFKTRDVNDLVKKVNEYVPFGNSKGNEKLNYRNTYIDIYSNVQ